MIRLNKGVASFAVAMAFAVGFSSCGGEKKSSAAASSSSNAAVNVEKAVEKPAQITWMVHDGLKKENGTDQWAAEFTKLTGIKMNLNIVSNNEYSQLLDLAFASGETPDVFDLAGDRFAAFVKQGAVADLTDYIKNSELSTTIDKSIWDSIAINGHYYGIPKEMPNGVVTYVRQAKHTKSLSQCFAVSAMKSQNVQFLLLHLAFLKTSICVSSIKMQSLIS